MPPEKQIVVAAKAVVIHNRHALLLHRSPSAHHGAGIWEFSGGKLEFGETLPQALQREISEETGLTATVEQLLYATTVLTQPNRQAVIICYLCHADSGSVHLSFEHDDYFWATQRQMLEMLDRDIVRNLQNFNVLQSLDIEK